MKLTLHDTLAREKREFVPTNPERVTLYVCGPTVYNTAHIGNARPAVVFDTLFRVLRDLYGADQVIYARNITDVDDKINARAAADGVDISVITEKYTEIYRADMAALGVLSPSLEPKVTAHMDAIITQIGQILAQGHAYEAEGHVLFDVASFPEYGQLSGRNLEDMIAGARVEVAPYKRNPQDFVLWKPSKPGEPSWDSPWGAGRPGWHIECSAMIDHNLGLPIDIHGGGMDLVFPHHENEIAQGRCAHAHAGQGAEYARYWMHNGFLTMDAEKMSKSLGNVQIVHDLLKSWPGEVLRLSLLSAHYRAPLDWTDALLGQSSELLNKLYQALSDAGRLGIEAAETADPEALSAVRQCLCDDLNTPGAVAALNGLYRSLREALSHVERAPQDAEGRTSAAVALATLQQGGALIGLLQSKPSDWFQGQADEGQKAEIDALVAARTEARTTKNWAEADRIRDALAALKVEVMDGPSGATWKFKT